MIDKLNVLNGKLSPEFDKYNNKYSVLVNSDTDYLILDYLTVGDCFIDIIGNSNFHEKENIVNIKAICDEDESNYELLVYKEKKEEVKTVLSIQEEEYIMPDYIPYTIICSCAFLIIILFLIIFHRRRIK